MQTGISYQLNEFELNLPANYLDESFNILQFPELKSSLVITRGQLKPPQTLEQYYGLQIATLKKEMKNFLVDSEQSVIYTRNNEQNIGYEISCTFDKSGQKIHQFLLIIQIQHVAIVLAYAQARPFDQGDLQHWQTIKSKFDLRIDN